MRLSLSAAPCRRTCLASYRAPLVRRLRLLSFCLLTPLSSCSSSTSIRNFFKTSASFRAPENIEKSHISLKYKETADAYEIILACARKMEVLGRLNTIPAGREGTRVPLQVVFSSLSRDMQDLIPTGEGAQLGAFKAAPHEMKMRALLNYLKQLVQYINKGPWQLKVEEADDWHKSVLYWVRAEANALTSAEKCRPDASNSFYPKDLWTPSTYRSDASTHQSTTNNLTTSPPRPQTAKSVSKILDSQFAAAERSVLGPAVIDLIPSYPVVSTVGELYSRLGDLELKCPCDEASTRGSTNCVSFKSFVKAHGTLANALRDLEEFGILVSSDGVRCTAVKDEKDKKAAVRLLRTTGVQPLGNIPICSQLLGAATLGPMDYFSPDIATVPDPPDPSPGSESAIMGTRTRRKTIRDGSASFSGVFTAQMLVPIVPTYFVPVEAVVAQLPEGYTEEHITSLFLPTGTIERVTLMGKSFLRLHGGERLVEMMRADGGSGSSDGPDCENAAYAPYRPDPSLCAHFVDCMKMNGIRPREWVSLRRLLTEFADPEFVALLPFKKYFSLLYFAEMQHVFMFSAEGEGHVCYLDLGAASLTFETTPVPALVNEMYGIVFNNPNVSIETIVKNSCVGPNSPVTSPSNAVLGGDLDEQRSLGLLSPYSRDALLRYFDGNLFNFFAVHRELFYVEPPGLVTLTRQKRINDAKAQPIEQQIRACIANHDFKTLRKLRRKMARERNPDSPLLDQDNLAEELHRLLPKNSGILLKTFVSNLPPEITDFLPVRWLNIFRRVSLFKLYEEYEPGRLCVCRAELPYPDHHLRLVYTDEELLQLLAGLLQCAPGGKRTLYNLHGRLPYHAQERIRLVHKNIFEFMKNYPQYFTIVFKNSVRMDSRQAVASLIGAPPQVIMEDDLAREMSGADEFGNYMESAGGSKDLRHKSNRINDIRHLASRASEESSNEAVAELKKTLKSAGYSVDAQPRAGDGMGLTDELETFEP